MANVIDIFNPQTTVLAKGLEGKSLLVYGSNSVGKTSQTIRASKPFVIATESGLNATAGIPYARINSWSDLMKIVKQFTSKQTVEKARAMYDTIIIDEMYAASLLCQDYVIATYGQGALTLGDGTGKVNLYQMYEKLFFKMVNTLLSASYTVIFIGHEQQKQNEKIQPKGDKRCVDPIKDFVDYVVYVRSNGVDEDGKVIKSSAFLAETDEFFARSRFDGTPTYIPEFTIEALEEAIKIGIEAKEKETGVKAVTYQEQKEKNTNTSMTFEEVQEALQVVGERFYEADQMDILTEIVEDTLGVGGKVSAATKKQLEALLVIYDELIDKAEELGI